MSDDVIRIAARAYEQDRYLSALLSPRQCRNDLIILHAFAGEVGRIASTVSEPMLGAIRLQWWRDVLQTPGDSKSGHPVADGIVDVRRRYGLPSALLLGIIDAEDGPVQSEPVRDRQALAGYFAKRDGALFALAWRILNGDRAVGADPVLLSRAGQVYGATRMLVELAAAVAEGRSVLPEDLLAEHGVTENDLKPGVDGCALRGAITTIRTELISEISDISRGWGDASATLRLAVLPVALVEPYLSAQEKLGTECLRQVAEISPLARVWRLWRAKYSGGL